MSVGRRVLLSLLAITASLFAQESRGRVQGDVRDASGAMVAGATVTLSNDDSGVRTVRPTSETGHYLFDFVIPGHYSVIVDQPQPLSSGEPGPGRRGPVHHAAGALALLGRLAV